MSFSSQLQKAMGLMNISQAELAERAGLARSSISQYVSGKNIPKESTIEKIANVVGVTSAFLNATDETGKNGLAEDARRVSVAEAAKRMGKNRQYVRNALIDKRLPFGSAVKKYGKDGEGKWSFHIPRIPFERYLGMEDEMQGKPTGS